MTRGHNRAIQIKFCQRGSVWTKPPLCITAKQRKKAFIAAFSIERSHLHCILIHQPRQCKWLQLDVAMYPTCEGSMLCLRLTNGGSQLVILDWMRVQRGLPGAPLIMLVSNCFVQWRALLILKHVTAQWEKMRRKWLTLQCLCHSLQGAI